MFKNNTSIVAKRFDRAGRAISKKPHLHIEPDCSQVTVNNQVLIYIDNFYDEDVHLCWVFADKLIGNNWERVVMHGRGDSLDTKESKVAILNKEEFTIGKWKITVSYDGISKSGEYLQSESKVVEVEQLNGKLLFNPLAD